MQCSVGVCNGTIGVILYRLTDAVVRSVCAADNHGRRGPVSLRRESEGSRPMAKVPQRPRF